jgi:hypothetical protein
MCLLTVASVICCICTAAAAAVLQTQRTMQAERGSSAVAAQCVQWTLCCGVCAVAAPRTFSGSRAAAARHTGVSTALEGRLVSSCYCCYYCC